MKTKLTIRPTAFPFGLLLIGIITIIAVCIWPKSWILWVSLTFPVTFLWGWFCATRKGGAE